MKIANKLLELAVSNLRCCMWFEKYMHGVVWWNQGNLKGESVVAAILPSRMEVGYCTFGFFHS